MHCHIIVIAVKRSLLLPWNCAVWTVRHCQFRFLKLITKRIILNRKLPLRRAGTNQEVINLELRSKNIFELIWVFTYLWNLSVEHLRVFDFGYRCQGRHWNWVWVLLNLFQLSNCWIYLFYPPLFYLIHPLNFTLLSVKLDNLLGRRVLEIKHISGLVYRHALGVN